MTDPSPMSSDTAEAVERLTAEQLVFLLQTLAFRLEGRADAGENVAIGQHFRSDLEAAIRAAADHVRALLIKSEEQERRIDRLGSALTSLRDGAAIAYEALPADQQDGTVGDFLAAILRTANTGLLASDEVTSEEEAK